MIQTLRFDVIINDDTLLCCCVSKLSVLLKIKFLKMSHHLHLYNLRFHQYNQTPPTMDHPEVILEFHVFSDASEKA